MSTYYITVGGQEMIRFRADFGEASDNIEIAFVEDNFEHWGTLPYQVADVAHKPARAAKLVFQSAMDDGYVSDDDEWDYYCLPNYDIDIEEFDGKVRDAAERLGADCARLVIDCGESQFYAIPLPPRHELRDALGGCEMYVYEHGAGSVFEYEPEFETWVDQLGVRDRLFN
jgi:hypothetical protein